MEVIIQLLACVLPIIAFLCVVLVILVNFYLKIRRTFPIKVNCWFCNGWTKTHYDDRNSFECPTCLQYNGFDSNGDYNRQIPAQRDELLNQRCLSIQNRRQIELSNGLCHLCNNNQQLKIYQLAHFIPLNEVNFDVEIEHFQKQLEKAYKLCPPCQRVVNNTIRKQNCLLGLSFAKLRSKGIKVLDLNNPLDRKSKRLALQKMLRYCLVGFAVLNFSRLVYSIYGTEEFEVMIPKPLRASTTSLGESLMRIFNLVFAWLLDMYELVRWCFELPILMDITTYVKFAIELFEIPKQTITDNLLCCVGAFLQLLLLFWGRRHWRISLVNFLLWCFLVSTSIQSSDVDVKLLEIVCSLFIAVTTWRADESRKAKKQSVRKKNNEEEFSNCEDPKNFSYCNSTFKQEVSPNANGLKPVFGQGPVFQNDLRNRNMFSDFRPNSLNLSLTTESFGSEQDTFGTINKTKTSQLDSSFNKMGFDIDLSLNKLNLGESFIRRRPVSNVSSFCVNNDLSRPKPVVSPAKFNNVTQNSWVAGGFWRNSSGMLMPINLSHMSRSSSQTSGFISQNERTDSRNFNSLPSSVNNSVCGDFDYCSSIVSEPYFVNGSYVVQGNASLKNSKRAFYPVLNRELVYIAPNNSTMDNLVRNRSSFRLDKSLDGGSLLKDWIEKIDS